MFQNYIKIALRKFIKNKVQSFVNIFGLAIGMLIFIFITMFCINELSYNKFHSQHENIYQVELGDGFYTMAPLGIMFKKNIPDFETVVRVDKYMGGGKSPIIETNTGYETKKTKVKDIIFADPEFFKLFDFKVIYGNLPEALKEPYSIVLTSSMSIRLFGTENSLGKKFHYIGDRNSQPKLNLTVKAVIKDVPNNSTLTFNAVGSLSTLYSYRNIEKDWSNWMYETFVKLKQNDINTVKNKVNKIWEEQEKKLGNSHQKINLISIVDVYFHNNSKKKIIILLQLIGIFILAIAVINFINLTLAMSISRIKEIGMRKVVGAHRLMLIKQFLGESIFTCLLSAVIAILILIFSKHYLFNIIGKEFPLGFFSQPHFAIKFIVGVTIIGLIAGIYPAVVFSRFKTSTALKGIITKNKKGNPLRHTLIVFQFTISIFLIICTFLITKQVDYLKTKDLGFNSKNIIHFNQSKQIGKKYDIFKQKLLTNKNIKSVARSNTNIGKELPIGAETQLNGFNKQYRATTVDPDFIRTMEFELIKGRGFSWDIKGDKKATMIVNETFVKEFGLKEPLGTEILFLNKLKPRIIGVIKDFHYNSFHQKIAPAAFIYADWNSRINIRIDEQNISQTIKYIGDVWNELSPETPFEFEFLDKTYNSLYISEEQFQNIIISFSIAAIIIACLGLLALVSHMVSHKIKEIGVRKVLGATVSSIIFSLTKDLMKWVLLANLFAWPFAYFSADRWLENFAYKIDLTVWPFLLAGLSALAIALLTVSLQAIKAASANPVESLKCE